MVTSGLEVPGGSGASRNAIEHHYDVGADFYALWLDRAMVYSCALWDGPLDDDLDAAQTAKLDWHARTAGAQGAARVLDVGCGWGAMLHRLGSQWGVGQVTGLTLSADQAAVAAAAVPGAEVRLEDWRDHEAPPGHYDAIVSIGAFEHFARLELDTAARRAVYADFFAACARWLPDGGRLSLQTIAYEDFDPATGAVSSFFSDEIFPESSLPTLSDVVVAAEPWFRLVAFRSDAVQYEHTLHLWQRRLEASREEATASVGRDTYRRYIRYLRVSRAMFDRRTCTLLRLGWERRPAAIGRQPTTTGGAR
jgi:cyclopropane-fatty-acyl-phospholipid synthase